MSDYQNVLALNVVQKPPKKTVISLCRHTHLETACARVVAGQWNHAAVHVERVDSAAHLLDLLLLAETTRAQPLSNLPSIVHMSLL
jgi:hypothetical protein